MASYIDPIDHAFLPGAHWTPSATISLSCPPNVGCPGPERCTTLDYINLMTRKLHSSAHLLDNTRPEYKLQQHNITVRYKRGEKEKKSSKLGIINMVLT